MYSIFVLGESQLSISGATGLDGVTQGDGSHLVNATITLNSTNYQEIFIRDNDANFRDNDGSQRLDGAQDVDGTVFSDGTRVEAEYGLTLTDGTNTYQAIGFNVSNSSPSYATVEGLSFVGELPPANVPLTVAGAQEGPNFQVPDYATPICFAKGTPIRTPRGFRAIETLQPGDLVWTADRAFVALLWQGGRVSAGQGKAAPVVIPPGVLGARHALRVSQQHRVLVSDPRAELEHGSAEVFVPAIALVDAGFAYLAPRAALTYHHLLLPAHHVIDAGGLHSESLFSGDVPLYGGDPFFSVLRACGLSRAHLARPALTRREALPLLWGGEAPFQRLYA